MKSQPLDNYFSALDRMKKGCPTKVPKGTKITNDAVAREAGRGNGSIKKSRPVFAALIRAIDEAAAVQSKPENELKERLNKLKGMGEQLRRELEAALGRELSLLKELYEVKKELSQIKGSKVVPLR